MLNLSPRQLYFEYLPTFQSPYLKMFMCHCPEILYLCDAGVCMCVFTNNERLYEIQDKNEKKRASKVNMRAGKACKKTWGVRIGCVDEFILGFR